LTNQREHSHRFLTPRFLLVTFLVVIAASVAVHLIPVRPEKGQEEQPLPPLPEELSARKNQVVVFGLDAANWSQLLPMLQQGRLPTLARLMEQGCYGHLKTLEPTVSPMIWTSVATGKGPDKHGIRDFMVRVPGREEPVLAGTAQRQSLAVWNILSHFGRRVGVVNWFCSAPAEAVEGFVISDMAAQGRRLELARKSHSEELSQARPGYIYPETLEALENTLPDFKADLSSLSRFARLEPEDEARLEEIQTYEVGQPLSVLKYGYLSDAYYHAMSQAIVSQAGNVDLLLYYFNSPDALGHTLWKYAEPEGFPHVDAEDQRRFSDTIELYYEWLDELMSDILSAYPPDVNVICLSDHGMLGMPDVTTGVKRVISARHSNHPMVCAAGRDFQNNAVFPTHRIEGEHFEQSQGTINYQEAGYRNLNAGGWMETVIVTPAGKMQLKVDCEFEGEGEGVVLVELDGSKIGRVSSSSKSIEFESGAGLHRLRLSYPASPDTEAVHPAKIPWKTSGGGKRFPEPFTTGRDWGYALWQDSGEEGLWHLRWTGYPGRLFELDPVFSGSISIEPGNEMDYTLIGGSERLQVEPASGRLRFEHLWQPGDGETGLDIRAAGEAEFDLMMNGDRYTRMVYLAPFSRALVDAVELQPAGVKESWPPQPGVMDVAPTILALYGLPPGEDMDGRVWREYLKESVLKDIPAPVASYEVIGREEPSPAEGDDAMDEGTIDRLRALGYINSGGKSIYSGQTGEESEAVRDVEEDQINKLKALGYLGATSKAGKEPSR
jgi:hypothetical protein